MKRVSLFLSCQQIRRLKARSDAEGLSVAELIRRAIDLFLSGSLTQRTLDHVATPPQETVRSTCVNGVR